MSSELNPDLSRDTLQGGGLVCWQHKEGYRFSLDAILLAHFAPLPPGGQVLDLGAGSGVVGLMAASLEPTIKVISYELQESLLKLIRLNIKENSLEGRWTAVAGDVRSRQGLVPEAMDLVLCNPPYGKLGRGRLNPGHEQAVARHELAGELADFVKAAAFSVKNRSPVAFVYPAAELTKLITTMADFRLEPKRLRLVHSYPGAPAKLALVSAVKNGGAELQVAPPLFIYQERGGEYSAEVAALFGP
ncbi:MAG: methyltransferase [Thermodesulfobacteriota bacterium]